MSANIELTFDHVAHQVPDIGAAADWYRRTIPGCRVLYQDESWAFLEIGGVRVALVSRGQHPGHVAWRVSEENLERLAEQYGRTIKPHRDRTRSFYLEGPGGLWIEIISYPPNYQYV